VSFGLAVHDMVKNTGLLILMSEWLAVYGIILCSTGTLVYV
jgi:hypothetical protein